MQHLFFASLIGVGASFSLGFSAAGDPNAPWYTADHQKDKLVVNIQPIEEDSIDFVLWGGVKVGVKRAKLNHWGAHTTRATLTVQACVDAFDPDLFNIVKVEAVDKHEKRSVVEKERWATTSLQDLENEGKLPGMLHFHCNFPQKLLKQQRAEQEKEWQAQAQAQAKKK